MVRNTYGEKWYQWVFTRLYTFTSGSNVTNMSFPKSFSPIFTSFLVTCYQLICKHSHIIVPIAFKALPTNWWVWLKYLPIQPRPLLKRPLSYELNNRSDDQGFRVTSNCSKSREESRMLVRTSLSLDSLLHSINESRRVKSSSSG